MIEWDSRDKGCDSSSIIGCDLSLMIAFDRRTFLKLCPAAVLWGKVDDAFSADAFALTLVRTFENERCTTGELFSGRDFLCHTLEQPWRDNQTDASAIPAANYPGFLRYDKDDQWRIQLRNTAPRVGVQIHIGNYPANSTGCILPGLGVQNASSSLRDSAKAYAKLKTSFYGTATPIMTPDKSITLRVLYNPRPTEFIVRDNEARSQATYRQDGTAWLLFSESENGKHVWNERLRDEKYIYFDGTEDAGVWTGRQISLRLHGGSDMFVRKPGGQWRVFGQGATITRSDATMGL